MSSAQAPSPDAIFAGLAVADREALCGLLATLDAAGLVQVVGDAAAEIRRRIDRDAPGAAERLKARARELHEGALPDDALRLALWRGLVEPLAAGRPDAPPLSPREARRGAAVLAVRAAEALGPSAPVEEPSGRGARLRDRLSTLRREGLRASALSPPSFPDIVAREVVALARGIDPDAVGDLDPKLAEALHGARRSAGGLAAAGGGWAALAATVGGAGFAPYILAAQASAFIPFVGGPALVSFLAVMVNPITMLAGLGGFAMIWRSRTRSARSAAAARIATLLAVQGLGREREGLAELVDAFRRASRQDPEARTRLLRIESRLGWPLGAAAGPPPGAWAAAGPKQGSVDRAADAAATLAAGGLTAGDMLHHAVSIDPDVVSAADFSRTAEIEDPFDLAAHALDFATRGAEIALRGYAAERLVVTRLIEEGHDAILAPDSTTPGFDLLVNGEPVQVKCGISLSLLEEHFARYPEIPVIANADLAQQAAAAGAEWSAQVSTVEGFELDLVEEAVRRSLDAAEGLAAPDVVLAAACVGAARGAFQVWRGAIPLRDLPAWMALDLAARTGLAAAGAKAGAFAGLVTMGPAGAVVLGPAIGAAAQAGAGRLRREAEQRIRAAWGRDMIAAAARLNTAYADAIERRTARLSSRVRNLPAGAGVLDWLRARAEDDAVFAASLQVELGPAPSDEPEARRLLAEARREALADRRVLAAGHDLSRVLADRPDLAAALVRGIGNWKNPETPAQG